MMIDNSNDDNKSSNRNGDNSIKNNDNAITIIIINTIDNYDDNTNDKKKT